MDAHQGKMHGCPSGWDGTKWPCPEPTHSALVACSKDDPSQLEEAVQKIRECGGRHPLSELLLWGVPFGEKSFFLEKKNAMEFDLLTEFSSFLFILVQVIWQWPQLGNSENGKSRFCI